MEVPSWNGNQHAPFLPLYDDSSAGDGADSCRMYEALNIQCGTPTRDVVGGVSDVQEESSPLTTVRESAGQHGRVKRVIWFVLFAAPFVALGLGLLRNQHTPSPPAPTTLPINPTDEHTLSAAVKEVTTAAARVTWGQGQLGGPPLVEVVTKEELVTLPEVLPGRGLARVTSLDGGRGGGEDACSTVVVLSVGTAMTTGEYDSIAEAIVREGNGRSIVVVVDPVPGDPIKFVGSFYHATTQYVKAHLGSWVGDECAKRVRKWVVGGHSAGGWAAHEAVVSDPQLADGIFSLDPYEAGQPGMTISGEVAIPSMYWGFTNRTCMVDPKLAARDFYSHTLWGGLGQHRVLYLVDNDIDTCTGRKKSDVSSESGRWRWWAGQGLGGGHERGGGGNKGRGGVGETQCPYTHCSFAQGGDCRVCSLPTCGVSVSNCASSPPDDFYVDVAKSFDWFARQLLGQWDGGDTEVLAHGGRSWGGRLVEDTVPTTRTPVTVYTDRENAP